MSGRVEGDPALSSESERISTLRGLTLRCLVQLSPPSPRGHSAAINFASHAVENIGIVMNCESVTRLSLLK
jgi:hypothetical protein